MEGALLAVAETEAAVDTLRDFAALPLLPLDLPLRGSLRCAATNADRPWC